MSRATCRKCGSEFEQTDAARARGVHQCTPCRVAANKAWREASRAAGVKMPGSSPEGRRRNYLRDQERYHTDPETRLRQLARARARQAAKTGKITKAPCEVCGVEKVEAHHDDYSQPLNVRWLCPTHHRQHHSQPMPAPNTRYFLSADRKTQCAVPMSDDLHRMIWGVATYSNVPHDGAEVITAADPLTWLQGQIAVRCGKDNAAFRMGKARAAAPALDRAA